MRNTGIIVLALTMSVLSSCNQDEKTFDASGSFEAVEVIISSEATGRIKQLDLEEGQVLQAGQMIGYVDSVQLYLKKKQVRAQITALLSQKPNMAVQLASLQERLRAAEKEEERAKRLVEAGAATTKQLDDISAQTEVIRKQIEAQRSVLEISTEGIGKKTIPLLVQVEQINDMLDRCRIVNPVNGTVLTKYSETSEMAAPGKPLYKIADLSTIILRAYITGNQLSSIRLGQQVKVFSDDGQDGMYEDKGTITWISDKAEFTPKTIQTKDERADLVYAMKVKVVNDGRYKIGMYGEIVLTDN